ncbi:MAG: SgcJ/EcaC family oxidoreductase [Rhodobacteraceae bacterium]|nr:MAG: SgcJ/EcaC family oxidoreductase [Paracoccaceae bacterium]
MPHQEATKREIAQLFDIWNDALQSGDAAKVAALYAQDATLLPTLSKEVRRSAESIEDYFTAFLKLHPKAAIIHQNISLYEPIAINSGVYIFDTLVNGQKHSVLGRFTFIYRKDGEDWKIIEHHSSMMPDT